MNHILRPDGARIAWNAYGPNVGPAVLLCTMATAAMSVWEPVVTALGEDWRLVLHDRRGEGDSDAGAPETHAFASFRDDALAVLEAAGVETAVICGMAFGARVALRLALDAPRRTVGLILFDATGGPPAPEAERAAGRQQAQALRAAAGLAEPHVKREWFQRRDLEGRSVNAKALKGEPAWTMGLGGISVPTLIACGEQDPNLPGSRRLAEEIPGARLAVMPMAGHGSILDRPDLVIEHIATFLGGLSKPPAQNASSCSSK